jgi:xanthine dehydrogenase accessory factor
MSGPRDLARLARETRSAGSRGILAEITDVDGSHYRRKGARMVLTEDGRSAGTISGGCLEADLARRLPEVWSGKRSVIVQYDMRGREDMVWGLGLGCNGHVTIRLSPLDEAVVAKLEAIAPAVSLLVCGAGSDALPLCRVSLLLGWSVDLVARRWTPTARERFARIAAEGLRLPQEPWQLARGRHTAAVVMTHNFLDDLQFLRRLAPFPLDYIGVLGPRERTRRLKAALRADGISLRAGALHAPVGLDIGAEAPEEIALAIVAEIQASAAGRGGGFLRDRHGPIHTATEETDRLMLARA